ncbi:hypothetical protein STVA_36750 [Allostella vacuolata]|nr:hypothetical protein STVA_36750 [Stella vacuolata]
MRATPPAPSPGSACLDDLASRGVIFRPLPQPVSVGGCSLADGVSVEGMSAALNKPVTISCPTARVVDRWVDEIVQPAARRHLRTRVRTIHQAGGFVCRNTRGGRLSEHARGRAIDIWGFEMADGSKAVIRDHWKGAGARSRFLREVGQKSCGLFHVVLGPGADADHHDHLHLDLGEWKLCQL